MQFIFRLRCAKEKEMKKSLLFLLTLSFLPLSARAQITSLNVETKPFGHGWKQVVENRGSDSIVAMYWTSRSETLTKSGRTIRTAVSHTYDPLTQYGADPNVPPGGVVNLDAADPSKWTSGVDAVIFSDGHSEGDPKGVNAIYERRRGVYRGINEALPLLDTITNQGANPTEVADTVRHRWQALPNDRTLGADERIGLEQLYHGLENLLRTQRDMAAPSNSTSHRQPRIEEVAQVNGIPRQQAHAIVISKKYQEWKADLEDNLEPPVAK